MSEIGTITQLTAGAAILTLPDKSPFWFIQNQDIAPLVVNFRGARTGVFSRIVLVAADTRGGPGGYVDSVAFPYFDTEGFLLNSSIIDAQFGSGFSRATPVNDYPYPGNVQQLP